MLQRHRRDPGGERLRLYAGLIVSGRYYPSRWGAEPLQGGLWRFAIWAPEASEAAVEIENVATPMSPKGDGWLSATAPARPGSSYGFRIDGKFYPDPAARAQLDDVHGPSRLIGPTGFAWSADWQGIPWHQAVIYELHIGTFTSEGTLSAAQRELPRLKALGITLVELMPVAMFEGTRGWGYDGALLYAPHNAYGGPDALRQFVEAAHKLGLGVLLDVVYNHFGPAGNYLPEWCPTFFHDSRGSPWGQGIAYEEPAVRAFFIDNALYWLEEYQLDGLRLDAVHAIEDGSPEHLLDELCRSMRARDWGRHIHLIMEDERNPICPFHSGTSFDGIWNDDWHHAFHCLLTGEREGYYAPFAVDPLADIELALRDGYVEQGQSRPPRAERRGEPSDAMPRTAFINFLGNHDQTGNRAQGERLHQLVNDEGALRVVTALTLLGPFTPMLFMGDEFLTDAPFLFFTDFTGQLADSVRNGRAKEFARFSAFGSDVPDPNAPETAERSIIGRASTEQQREHEAFVRNLLALRAEHVCPLLAETDRPTTIVQRRGAAFDVTWQFATASLHQRFVLGGDDFSLPVDPFFVEAPRGGRFAFAAAVRKAGRP